MESEVARGVARSVVGASVFTTAVAATALFYLSIFNLGTYVAGLLLVAAILVALLDVTLVLSAAPPSAGVGLAGRILLWVQFVCAAAGITTASVADASVRLGG